MLVSFWGCLGVVLQPGPVLGRGQGAESRGCVCFSQKGPGLALAGAVDFPAGRCCMLVAQCPWSGSAPGSQHPGSCHCTQDLNVETINTLVSSSLSCFNGI